MGVRDNHDGTTPRAHLHHQRQLKSIMSAVRLSDSERAYIADGVAQGIRNDGRGAAEHRPLRVALGCVPQACGSAECIIQGAGATRSTRAVCAIRADIAQPSALRPGCGMVSVRVDASGVVSGRDWVGGGKDGENLGATYAKVLERVILGVDGDGPAVAGASGNGMMSSVSSSVTSTAAIDLESLCIQPGKACWLLAVDVVAASDRGSMIDAMSIAVRAALADAKIPKVTIGAVGDDAGDEVGELEVDDDPDACSRIDVSRLGVVVTTSKIGRHGVIDATEDEEACAESTMSVAVDREGLICGEFSSGVEGLDRGTATAMRTLARKVGVELIEKMDAYLATAMANTQRRVNGDEDEDEDDEDDEDARVMVVPLPELDE
jgi:exosome complex component RRP42